MKDFLKKRFNFILLPALVLLLVMAAVPVSAAPPGLPHNFSGTVKIEGTDAPIGTAISARVNGVEYGSLTTTVVGQYSDLLVTGLTDGDIIKFFVSNVDTTQTFSFQSGATTTLNLIVPDTTRPTVAITSTATSPTNTSPIPMTATFSENVTLFVLGDITVGNGTADNFTAVSGTVYTFDVTPTADGAVTVDIAADVAQDAASNNSTAATQFSITYDITHPTVAITSTATSPTNTSPIPMTATFNETVTGFVVGDITVGNGAADNFTAVSGSVYTFKVTPTADGVVTVNIAADVAIDAASNNNTAATQFSITYDSVAPTVAITSTATSPTNTSPIPMTATFSKNVTLFVLGDITVGNGTADNFTAVSGSVYTFKVTPTADGAVTVDIAADVAQDAASNNNTAATQFSITYDTTRPTVAITSTATSPTSTSPIPMTATFSESVTGFVVGDITVGNGTADNFTGSGSVYTFKVTPTADGAVTVDIAADVAQDAASNNSTAATQFSITYTPAVTINAVTSPTKVATQTLTGTRSSGATVVLTANTTATFGSVSYPATTTWTANVTLVEGSNVITATANTSTATATIVLDTTAPTVTSKSPGANAAGVAVNTVVTATFSEAMNASTITASSSFTLLTGSTPVSGSISYNSSTYTATFTPSGNLTYSTNYTATLSTAITDAVGNPLASVTWSFTTVAGSLGDEINATSTYGTLNLGTGTYSGNVTIDKPITITGTTGTIIRGGITIGELTGSNVTIENLTITDYVGFGIKIVKVRSVDTFVIRNNTIQGVSGSVVGIEVDEVETGGSLTIEKNSIQGNQIGIKLLAPVASATIRFNDITSNSVAGLDLAAGGNANAEKNWWGNLSGPKQATTNPRGEGNNVIGNASYQPWLTRQFATVQADNIAYFGYALVNLTAGWNIVSTPIALDPSADTWGEYVALGNPDLHIDSASPAYSFNTQTGLFVALTSSYQLTPGDAIYVRMTQADIAPILYSPNTSVPSKSLYAGWNLVGLSALEDMSVRDALTSVYKVPGDLTGYSQVVSPSIGNQTAWVYIRDGADKTMKSTKGYWVFMVNAPTGTTLAGFTFTPMVLPAQ